MVKVYSASKLSAFTFITPLFGVVAAYFILHDTLTPVFGLAALLVIVGLYLVNKPDPKVTPDPNVLAIVTNAQWNAVDAMATTEERGFSRKTESPAFADDDGRKSV
jgi:putative Mn2+ efflux pump MntP